MRAGYPPTGPPYFAEPLLAAGGGDGPVAQRLPNADGIGAGSSVGASSDCRNRGPGADIGVCAGAAERVGFSWLQGVFPQGAVDSKALHELPPARQRSSKENKNAEIY